MKEGGCAVSPFRGSLACGLALGWAVGVLGVAGCTADGGANPPASSGTGSAGAELSWSVV